MFSTVANSKNSDDLLKNFVMFLIVVFISTFIVRLLWNNALVTHITILKPISTLTDAFLLSLALNLLR